MRRRPLQSAVRRLAAAAAVLAAGWLAGGGDARAQRTADGHSLLGEWTGTYLCHNRKGLARATLSEAAGGGYRGTLSFIPSGEADGRTGRIEILARTGPDGLVDLAPRRWIVPLPGHNLLRFRGRLSPDGQSIRGAVLSPDCVDFALSFARPLEPAWGTRTAEPEPKPAPTPPPPLVPKGRLDYMPEIDCAAIADRGERDDCVVAERYRPRLGTGIAPNP